MTGLIGGLGAVALGMAVAVLLARRAATVGALLAVQGAALALAAMAQGVARGEVLPGLLAGALIAAKAAAVPLALRRLPDGLAHADSAGAARVGAVAVGVAFIGAGIAIARQASVQPATIPLDDLAIALGMLLVGTLAVVARAGVAWAVAGVLTVEAGALFLAIGVSPAVALAETLAAGVAITAAAVLAVPSRRAAGER